MNKNGRVREQSIHKHTHNKKLTKQKNTIFRCNSKEIDRIIIKINETNTVIHAKHIQSLIELKSVYYDIKIHVCRLFCCFKYIPLTHIHERDRRNRIQNSHAHGCRTNTNSYQLKFNMKCTLPHYKRLRAYRVLL